MPRYKVRFGYVFLGKFCPGMKITDFHKAGAILTLTKEQVASQLHKVEEISRTKANAEPVSKSIDAPSENRQIKQPEVKKTVPPAPAQTSAPVPAKPKPKLKPKPKPKASTKGKVVARKD